MAKSTNRRRLVKFFVVRDLRSRCYALTTLCKRSMLWNGVLVIATLLVCPWAAAQKPSASEALALEREGKFAEAAGAWRLVVKEEPRNAAAWASLGLDLARTQDYASAVAAY